MAQTELVRVVAYLEPGLAERLSAAAAADDRSVSREIARRLEASFGQGPSRAAVARTAAAMDELEHVVEKTRAPKPYDEEKRAVMVEHLQQQVPGVRPATAFPSVPQDLAGPVKPRPRSGS